MLPSKKALETTTGMPHRRRCMASVGVVWLELVANVSADAR
jgi:hypothetical protein